MDHLPETSRNSPFRLSDIGRLTLLLALAGIGLIGCQKAVRDVRTAQIASYCRSGYLLSPHAGPDQTEVDPWQTDYSRSLTDELGFRYDIRLLTGTTGRDCRKLTVRVTMTTPANDSYEMTVHTDCTGNIEHGDDFEEGLDAVVNDPYYRCLPSALREQIDRIYRYGRTIPNVSGEIIK